MKTLADVYAAIPKIECKGRCHGSCGPVPATEAEIRRVEKVSAEPWGVTQSAMCRQLTAGRCSVYEVRPLLCQLWGVTESLPCPWGCRPERVMADAEARMLLIAAGRIGGGYDVERIVKMAEVLSATARG